MNYYRNFFFLSMVGLSVFGIGNNAKSSDDNFEKLSSELRIQYPQHLSINIARIRNSYLGQQYLKNLLQNLGKSDPSFLEFDDMFFQNLDMAHVFSSVVVSNLGQSTKTLPPFVMVCRGHIDRKKWKRMTSEDNPAIESASVKLYRFSLGGDVRNDKTPLIPWILDDKQMFLGFAEPDTAIISFGESESTLREWINSGSVTRNDDEVAAFNQFRDKSNSSMFYSTAPMILSDNEQLKNNEVTIDLLDEIRLECKFECSTARVAAQLEGSSQEFVDQAKAFASPYITTDKLLARVFEELKRAVRVDRDLRTIKVSLVAPMALLHIWAREFEGSISYLDIEGDIVEARQHATSILLYSSTVGRLSDDIFPVANEDNKRQYLRMRYEYFDMDGKRKVFLNDDNFAIRMNMTSVIESLDSARRESTAWLGVDKQPVCNSSGFAKNTLVYESSSSTVPVDAKFMDENERRCSVKVFVKEVLPESLASQIGLMKGDQILSVDGIDATSIERIQFLLKSRIEDTKFAGANKMKLLLLSNGLKKEFLVDRRELVDRGKLGVVLLANVIGLEK